MNMEERKAGWLARVYTIMEEQVPKRSGIAKARLIASICQDAFNEGHKAGEEVGRRIGYTEGYQGRKEYLG